MLIIIIMETIECCQYFELFFKEKICVRQQEFYLLF